MWAFHVCQILCQNHTSYAKWSTFTRLHVQVFQSWMTSNICYIFFLWFYKLIHKVYVSLWHSTESLLFTLFLSVTLKLKKIDQLQNNFFFHDYSFHILISLFHVLPKLLSIARVLWCSLLPQRLKRYELINVLSYTKVKFTQKVNLTLNRK